jgi:hypothetical protein
LGERVVSGNERASFARCSWLTAPAGTLVGALGVAPVVGAWDPSNNDQTSRQRTVEVLGIGYPGANGLNDVVENPRRYKCATLTIHVEPAHPLNGDSL